MIPPARHGGRPRDVNVREVLNAIFYVLATGCQWKALPKDLPPKSTAHYYFMLWDWDGTLDRIHHTLYVAVREQAGREVSPSVAIIDSQSGKAAQKGDLRSIRRATMRARRLRVESGTSWSTRSASLSVAVHPANIQDRDGVALVLDRRTRRLFPFIERIYADGGYQGPKAAAAAARTGAWVIDIVKRSDNAIGFEIVPKRWIVERTIAWISRFRVSPEISNAMPKLSQPLSVSP